MCPGQGTEEKETAGLPEHQSCVILLLDVDAFMQLCNYKQRSGPGKMASWLKVLTALVENQSVVPSTHIRQPWETA